MGFIVSWTPRITAPRRPSAGSPQALPLLTRAAGSPVRGMIGSHNPLAAVHDALHLHGFDEILLSTLPVHVSRWLHIDLPRKVAALGVPLTTIVATGDETQEHHAA
jgi:hypothetical protein